MNLFPTTNGDRPQWKQPPTGRLIGNAFDWREKVAGFDPWQRPEVILDHALARTREFLPLSLHRSAFQTAAVVRIPRKPVSPQPQLRKIKHFFLRENLLLKVICS